jgi:predicted ATPase/DNA-binding winged helix-turn-helix (wHTH) protein
MSGEHANSPVEREYSFEPYRLIPAQQLLLCHETPLRLGGRALDILAELVERPGELVTKRELMTRAWPTSVVEESNLKVHIAALRRALGEGGGESRYIATITGRGYRFVAPVIVTMRQASQEPNPAAWEQIRKLPSPATRTTGRAETIAALLSILQQRRLVSIVGPGGIGKSTVALALAETFIAQADMEICFVELSSLADPKFLISAVATSLGLTVHSGDGVQSLAATLHERRLLLVLDSCEHVIDAVAVLVERILHGAPQLHVLTTSREPLRTASEYVYRLMPLEYPVQGAPLTAMQALSFSAVKLFALRAAECIDGYQLSDADAPAVVEICRRLEGIPLAIELAATRIDALGASELAAHLGDRFELLQRGRRGALERHRTLSASLDWSYDLLPPEEQTLLRKLALFSGAFDLEAAVGLCQDAPAHASRVVDGVANLVDKSLLVADVSAASVNYRLLDTTKAYALEKLEQAGETSAMRQRHLDFQCSVLARAAAELDSLSDSDWRHRYGGYLDDVRSALAWAHKNECTYPSAIELTVAAIPLWTELSLLEECYQCAERALARGPSKTETELHLYAAVAAAALYVNGPVPSTEIVWNEVLLRADQLQDSQYQLMALWGTAACRCHGGQLAGVLEMASRFYRLATSAENDLVPNAMERLVATAEHYSGDQVAARKRLENVLSHCVAPVRKSRLTRIQLNHRSASLAALANVLWLQGYPDQSIQTVGKAMQAARESNHPPSLMYAIANTAFPIMIHIGDPDGAQALLDELSDCMKKHAYTLWDTLWSCLQATLRIERGDLAALFQLERAVAQLQSIGYRPRLVCHLAQLAKGHGSQGRCENSLSLVEDALAQCHAGQEHWSRPELLRIKGALLEADDEAGARRLYRQAIELAEEQGSLSWQLRAANHLARLDLRLGARQEAPQLLRVVYQRFSEGFGTADLRQARRLLDQASLV